MYPVCLAYKGGGKVLSFAVLLGFEFLLNSLAELAQNARQKMILLATK